MGGFIRSPSVPAPPPPPLPAPLFRDSSGKEHKTLALRNKAQEQLDRKAKFPGSTANIGNLQTVRVGQAIGKPSVTNPVVATASSGSGLSIAGV